MVAYTNQLLCQSTLFYLFHRWHHYFPISLCVHYNYDARSSKFIEFKSFTGWATWEQKLQKAVSRRTRKWMKECLSATDCIQPCQSKHVSLTAEEPLSWHLHYLLCHVNPLKSQNISSANMISSRLYNFWFWVKLISSADL